MIRIPLSDRPGLLRAPNHTKIAKSKRTHRTTIQFAENTMSRYVSKALVDWSGFGKTIGDVQGSFSLLEFLDFCTVLEGIILYDELVPIGNKLKGKWEQEVRLLTAAGVISKQEVNSQPADVGPRPEATHATKYVPRNPQMAKSTLIDSWFETARLIGAEEQTGLSSLPLLRQRHIYEKYACVKEEHTFCNLILQHKNLSHVLQQLRRSHRLALAPYYTVPIPPVPLMVLERSTRKEDFLKNALEVRDEFSPLRSALTELRAFLDNPNEQLIEKVRYRNSWKKAWGTLGKYKESLFSIDLADASKDKISIERSLDGIALDSISLTKILEKLIAEASAQYHQRRVRILHRAAQNYIATSDGHINRHVARLYNCEINNNGFEYLKQFGIDANVNV